MQRRGFLGALGIGAGAVASGVAIGDSKDSRGIYVSLKCHTANCVESWRVFVDLTKPIMGATPQCPRCLMVMAYPENTAQKIKAWNVEHGLATAIHTPRKG